MKTMYFTQKEIYIDCEGRRTNYEIIGKYDTYEKAIEKAKTIGDRGMINTGNWQIVKATMNEETFVYTEEIIKKFNWYDEIGYIRNCEKYIKIYEEKIKDCEDKIIKCRTQNGVDKQNKQIEKFQKEIENYRKKIEENKKS